MTRAVVRSQLMLVLSAAALTAGALAGAPPAASDGPAAARSDGGSEQSSLKLRVQPGERVSAAYGAWEPGRFDDCPTRLHDRYATRGPDGRAYPGWHPPVVRDPATGRRCAFGHEHGRDPRGSDLYRWVARHMGGGLPFGVAAEALGELARGRPGVAERREDHVGHKVEWQDDVRLRRRTPGGRRRPPGIVTCDFLAKLHQGSHSADALANDVHELIYAVRCDDGTRLLTTTFARLGTPNGFARGCRPATRIDAGTALRYPGGPGYRRIPDRACVERHVLVPAGERSRFARGLYERWSSANRLTTRSGRAIAFWNPSFAVFNPARYADPAAPGGIARTVDLCWETTPAGERAAGSACDTATGYGARDEPLAYDDPRSPFDGTHREVYLAQTAIANRGGPRRWYTDPYGRRASSRPFPGSLCQLVAPVANRARPRLRPRALGSERPYAAPGIHAPN